MSSIIFFFAKEMSLSQLTTFKIENLPNQQLLFPINYSFSIFKGLTMIPLQNCNHNYNIIGHLEGDSIIYLFNPKHKQDIINKDNHEIKKWAHKIIMKPNEILFIPTNWLYIQEINDYCFQFHIDIDTYFSWIPNLLKL